MRSWPSPTIPRLPGRARPPRLYDTATDTVRPLEPSGPARIYVCGITPYDATHLGHANTYLAFDTVNRTLRDGGYEVRYVQNVTDVDDPLLERAKRDGVDWRELASREIDLYRDDMTALGVIPPDDLVGAVDSVGLVADWVVRLRDAGAAYRVDDDVYFSVDRDDRFGYESGYDASTMITLAGERGGDPDRPGKKNPLDPLLWRAERPGEPAWDSPLGRGRPGWHIECAAIAVDRLGMAIDVQGGGRDLVFPHHEMSRAHAETLIGDSPFARHYTHAGMVGYAGEKMSKSLGNLVLVSALRRDGADPAALRLALLNHHYRADYEWSDDQLGRAADRLGRWRVAFDRDRGPAGEPVLAEVRDRIADDLDTPGALRVIDGWADRSGHDPDAPGLVRDVALALLGV